MEPLALLLAGGDRRSIGDVERAVAAVLAAPERIAELVEALGSDDPVVPLRAADALEKLARERPEWLAPHRAQLVRAAGRTADSGVRWNLVQLLPTITQPGRSARALARRLEAWWRDDPSAIVRATSLDAVVRLAGRDAALLPLAERMLHHSLDADSAAVRARARKLTRR